MKKLLPIFITLLSLSETKAQVGVGVTSAILLNTSKVTGYDYNYAQITFSSGLIFKINRGKFMFRPGINYLQTGIGNTQSFTAAQNLVTKIKVDNLEIPLDVTFPVKVKKNKILFSLAPTLTFALGGKATAEIINVSNPSTPLSSNTQDLKFGKDPNELKRLDFGTKFGIGYEFNDEIQINASLKYGFTNVSNANNVVFKNNHFALSATWFFLQ